MECKCVVGLICRNVQCALVFTTLHYTERWYEPRCLSFSTFLHIFLTVLQPLDARIRSHRNLILKVGTYDPLLKLQMLSLVTIYWIHEFIDSYNECYKGNECLNSMVASLALFGGVRWTYLNLCHCLFVGHDMSPRHSEQLSWRS